MNPLDFLEFDIDNRIVELIDLAEGGEVTRSDLQGMSGALAKNIISNIAQFIQTHDYDLEDLI